MTWDWDAESRSRLEQFLSVRGILDGPLTLRRIGDGHSNLTYLVEGHGRGVVVRRPPPPPLPPGGHDVLREARFLAALRDTGIPVPAILATAEAGVVLDVPMFVMSRVDGHVVTDSTPESLARPGDRARISELLVDTLALLHGVDWRSTGLADIGRPDGFNERHLRRISGLVRDEHGVLPSAFAHVHDWLAASVPTETGHSLVHLDYRLGNVMIALDRPVRIAAVLDWELATVGDPLFDLASFLTSCPQPGRALTPTEDMGRAMLEEGYADHSVLIRRYAERTGRDVSRIDWFYAFALWKLAVLFEYGRRRAEAGVGDPYYAGPDKVDAYLAAAALAAAT
jgi:aminoglycoside phosphotransferase (APT) family kinase protein